MRKCYRNTELLPNTLQRLTLNNMLFYVHMEEIVSLLTSVKKEKEKVLRKIEPIGVSFVKHRLRNVVI